MPKKINTHGLVLSHTSANYGFSPVLGGHDASQFEIVDFSGYAKIIQFKSANAEARADDISMAKQTTLVLNSWV